MKKLWLSILLVIVFRFPVSAEEVGPAVAKFGFDYFHRLEDSRNQAFSPLSLHSVLALLSLGSTGETRTTSLSALHLDEASILRYGIFIDALSPAQGSLKLASRIWPSGKDPVSPKYLENSRQAFGAVPQALNFKNPEAARAEINRWTSEITQGLIKELIPSGGIKSDTALVLSNALFFQGSWAQPFPESATHEAVFHAPGKDKRVPFMKGKLKVLYKITDEYHGVSLPYAKSNLAMVFVMPTKPEYREKVRKAFGSAMLSEIEDSGPNDSRSIDYGEPSTVEICLPKFEVSESSKPLTLLKKTGLKRLLGGAGEFFIFENPRAPVVIDDCFHETVLKIDEKGTEAAAASALVVSRSVPAIAASITIDQPFFFAVYDRESKAPLFLGQIVEP